MKINLDNFIPKIVRKKPFVFGTFPNPIELEYISKLTNDMINWYWHTGKIIGGQVSYGPISGVNEKQNLRVDYENSAYKNFINEGASNETKEILDFLLTQQLNSKLIKTLWRDLISNRRDIYTLDILLAALATMFRIDLSKIYFFSKKPHFHSQIELSWLPNGGYIVPHTDSIHKMISVLWYLPQGGDENLGTSLWNNSQPNYSNYHISDKIEREDFYSKSELLAKPEFSSDKLLFFLRNEFSWHTLEQVDHKDADYVRLTMIYNLFIEKPLLKKIINIFRVRAK